VAGTVGGSTYGVANNVRLYAVRVLDCNGSGSNSGVIAGVDWVTNNHVKPAVANMSLGGGASSALDTAVNNSINAGVSYAVAAGNDNANACNYSPARVANAVTVGSTTNTDARSSFSNYGTCLDIFAPGSNITSAWHTSNTNTNTISGTSMASPHVAGVMALYLQGNPNATPATVTSSLTSNATTGKVTNAGSGSVNRLLFFGTGGTPTPTPTTTATPTATPPSGGTTYTGNLSGTGAAQIQPNPYYQSTASGLHKGVLSGPSGTDFDLRLYKWNGSSWAVVASSLGATSSETINYNGTAGYYYWRINSYSGSGNYTLVTQRP
jgi:subtilisin family serine protease